MYTQYISFSSFCCRDPFQIASQQSVSLANRAGLCPIENSSFIYFESRLAIIRLALCPIFCLDYHRPLFLGSSLVCRVFTEIF
jgi:hypothetical protein